MNKFLRVGCAVVAAAALIAGCSKDKVSGKLAFDSSAAFLKLGQEVTIGFSSTHVQSYSVTSKPEGWGDPIIDQTTKTITIVAPVELSDDIDKTGSVVVTGSVNGGSSVSATLFVGIVETSDLSAKQANSYLVNKPQTNYLIDVMHKGDGKSALATASVAVIWQSKSALIQYLTLVDGKASFYIGAEDDSDVIKAGNAVVGAYNAAGDLLWSWHVWATNYDPEAAEGTVVFNGSTMMTRNLGALNNDISSTTNILASYGLYYQWGRKDPFITPSTYQASNGASASMYNGSGSRVTLKTAASDSSVGTLAYATQNPLTYITAEPGSKCDWLAVADNTLWGAVKTVNDPCPYGWQVAPLSAYNALQIKGVIDSSYSDKYGMTFTDNSSESLFIGAGRRRYDNSTISNIYLTSEPLARNVAIDDQPWMGYYWTNTVSGSNADAYTFWFKKKNPAESGLVIAPYGRANGMQLRCVKVK